MSKIVKLLKIEIEFDVTLASEETGSAKTEYLKFTKVFWRFKSLKVHKSFFEGHQPLRFTIPAKPSDNTFAESQSGRR